MMQAVFPGLGFCLLVFEFNKPGISNYISNVERESMIEALKESVSGWADMRTGNQDNRTERPGANAKRCEAGFFPWLFLRFIIDGLSDST